MISYTDTRFLSMKELQKADADSIVQCLLDTLTEHGLDLNKCTGLGSDGASVMAGIHSGVSTQLRHLQPTLISVHCVAHRLALAVVQAAKLISPVEKIKNYINSLFVYFPGSAKRQGRLQAAFQALENKPALKLRKPLDTRWLACDEAVQVVRKSIQPLSLALQDLATSDNTDATALGLSCLISKYEFVAGVFFMAEILPILTCLSKTFQFENLDFFSIKPALRIARESINVLKTHSESNSADWQQDLLEMEQNTTPLTGRRDNFLLTFVSPFIQAVLDNLSARFPDEDLAADVFSPSKIPANSNECYTYGRNQIKTMAQHYGCDVERTICEWKEVILELKQNKAICKIREALHFLVTSNAIYPNLSKISSSPSCHTSAFCRL